MNRLALSIGRTVRPMVWIRMWKAEGESRLLFVGTMILVIATLLAIVGPSIAPYDPTAVKLGMRLLPPSPEHWLGTDQLGRDILSRLLSAVGLTLFIAFASVALGAMLGITTGIVSGYFGGWFDKIMMRVVDVWLAFPMILLAIISVAVIGTSVPGLIAVIVLAGWARYVRVIRAQTMVIRQAQFVEAATATGAGNFRIIRKYISVNLLTECVTLASLELARIILLESSLSYLGLGIQPPAASFGNMLAEGQLYMVSAWWVVAIPGFCIMLLVLAANLVAEGSRVLYDNRQSEVGAGPTQPGV